MEGFAKAAVAELDHKCCQKAVQTAFTALCCKNSAVEEASASGAKSSCLSSAAATKTASSCSSLKSASTKTASAKANKKASACEKTCGAEAAAACASLKTASSCSGSAEAAFASISQREGKRLVLTGEAKCAKCDFAMEECSPVFQTADGKVYPLVKNDYTKKMKMKKAEAENGFEIVTKVRKLDGVKYLEVRNLKVL
jgi:hypothetical protein